MNDTISADMLEKSGLILFVCDRRACDQCRPGCIRTPDPRHAYNFEVDSRGNLVERPVPAPEV